MAAACLRAAWRQQASRCSLGRHVHGASASLLAGEAHSAFLTQTAGCAPPDYLEALIRTLHVCREQVRADCMRPLSEQALGAMHADQLATRRSCIQTSATACTRC